MARGMKRLTLEEYLIRFKQFSHANEYSVLSKFKLFTQNCIVHYMHNTCGTKFCTKPSLFELKKSLCPNCSSIEDMSSTTIENIPWEKAPKTIPVRVLKAQKRKIWLEKQAEKKAKIEAAKEKSRVRQAELKAQSECGNKNP